MDSKKNIIIAAVWAIIVIAIAIIIFSLTNNAKTLHTISFIINGGEYIFNQEVKDGKTINKPTNPSKEGYEFLGWYMGGEKYDFSKPVKESLTLEAKWEKINKDQNINADNKNNNQSNTQTDNVNKTTQYTVTFNSNGGTSVKKQTVEKGKKATAPKNPTKSGYTFNGWFLNGKKFDFSTPITANITLKAEWKKDDVVSYKIEKVTNSVMNQVRVYITLNGEKVAGTADVINTQGETIKRDIPASGWLTFAGTVEKLQNIKVK